MKIAPKKKSHRSHASIDTYLCCRPHEIYTDLCQHFRAMPPPSNQAVARVGERIAESIGHGHVNDLCIHPNSRKYRVPSASHPYLQYVGHRTDSDKRNSCTCEAHKRRTTWPCKHVLALKSGILGH
jgi:hypothetical protein